MEYKDGINFIQHWQMKWKVTVLTSLAASTDFQGGSVVSIPQKRLCIELTLSELFCHLLLSKIKLFWCNKTQLAHMENDWF